ncbi:TIGR02569 family protein [Micromonosporaceae bacterium Da 78-11]
MIPRAVLRAFDVSGVPVPLPGGKGGTWRAGDLVLKPSEGADESRWRSATLAAVPESSGFQVPRPRRAADGDWLAAGWEAWQLVPGTSSPTRVDDVLRAGAAFHAAVADVPRPGFLDDRDEPWSCGDRVAWSELPIAASPAGLALLEPLAEARRPVDLPAQIVHGDLLGNVLFADGPPPAIIDWSPYWRPTSWAAAVAVVDALCWHAAEPELIDRWAHLSEWGQMLIRALIYRIATREARGAAEPNSAYAATVRLALEAA